MRYLFGYIKARGLEPARRQTTIFIEGEGMTRQETVSFIEENGVVAVIRLGETKKMMDILQALKAGGVRVFEFTLTTPNALEFIKEYTQKNDRETVVGAGTVLDPETARLAILAGAQFIVGPALNLRTLETAHRYDKAMIPGSYTPTEILTAWENGADVVKVFPATTLGPGYFKDVLGPLPQVKLTPTGGVALNNVAEWIRCGACCVGVGTALLDKKMIAESDWKGLTAHAAAFIGEVRKGRGKAS
jgi:2-dehydro-3-deoxyphosphogluconate aldolase / (4S)-4-hydroxy-2-oxoglutarate aldolase